MQKRTRRILALLCAGVLSVVGVFSGLHFGCTFPILLEDAEHGTIYCTKSRARLFSSAVICLYPDPGFTIERVTVNGEDQTEKLQRDRLTLYFIHGEIVVHASFKKQAGRLHLTRYSLQRKTVPQDMRNRFRKHICRKVFRHPHRRFA